MESFKEFLGDSEVVEFVLNEFNAPPYTGETQQSDNLRLNIKPKIWSAKKAEILQMWRNLKPDVPIFIQPMLDKPEGVEKSSYGEDGIRITGSFSFIAGVLSRLKDIATYENPKTKLRLIFRGIDTEKQVGPDRRSYVFYINLENRSRRKAGSKKSTVVKPIVPPPV
jgi:hypothetical protein